MPKTQNLLKLAMGEALVAVKYLKNIADPLLFFSDFWLMKMGDPIFNLCFGDLNEKDGTLSDMSISNNEDRHKIPATIAGTVIDFTNQFDKISVYATGSTPSGTGLYQMGIFLCRSF